MTSEVPEFCDYACPHADFPPADTAGLCRTMAGVWCKKLGKLTNKNRPCEWLRVDGGSRKGVIKQPGEAVNASDKSKKPSKTKRG